MKRKLFLERLLELMTPSVMQLLPLLEGMGNHFQGLQEAYLGLQIIKVVCE